MGKERKEYKFLGDWRWLYNLEGFGEIPGTGYKLYKLFILSWSFLVLLVSLYGACNVLPDKERAIDGLHSALIALFAIWGLTTWGLTGSAVYHCGQVVREGFYRYPEEDEEIQRMEAGVGREVRWRSRQFFWIMFFGALSNVIFFPFSQLILLSAEQVEEMTEVASPYFPHYLFLPWSTRSFLGMAGGFLIHGLIFVYTYGMAIVMNEIYINLVIQLITQLRILNHSIRTIRKRAHRMHTLRYGEDAVEERSLPYQACLKDCLIHNIKHHQVLLRYTKTCQPFIGSIFLLIVFLASIIFGCIFYLIMKKPPVNVGINHLMSLYSEQSYTFYTCYFGEIVMAESGELFDSLYFIEWPDAERKFTRSLHIFRIFTRRPIKIKSHLLDFTASLESYADFMSAMYKIMNIMRQSDKTY